MRIALRRPRAGLALGALLLLAASASRPAAAATLEGLTFPDTATVGGATVKLNGLGLRKAYVFVKVYVAALYLQTPTHDAKAAIDTDEAKRVAMGFLRDVTHEEMKTAWTEGFATTATPDLKPKIDQFTSYFTVPIQTGQQYEFDYSPASGTTVSIAGQVKGTIPGADFMRALWGIWLGAKPPSEALKDGMLGKS